MRTGVEGTFPHGNWLAELVTQSLAEDIGAILQTRFAMTTTTYGGAALDVDDKEQFAVIGSRFHRWRAIQEDLHGRRKQPLGESDPLNKAMP